jgi:hypothetical protein
MAAGGSSCHFSHLPWSTACTCCCVPRPPCNAHLAGATQAAQHT